MVYVSGWVGPSFWLLFSALSLIGFLGNGLVIAAVLGHAKMRRSAMNLLLLNLALADLFNLALTSLEWSPALWTGIPQWPLASLWWSCPVARYLECVFLFASILSQLAVCAERFVAICFPLNARRWCTQSNAIISLLAIWVFVLLFALPNALFNELLTLHPSSSSSSSSSSSNSSSFSSSSLPPATISFCLNPWSLTELWLAYKWAEFLLLFLVPALCCAFLHSRLCVALQSAKGGGHHEHLLLDKGTEQMRARRRVVRMLIGCVAVQLLCYSPIQAMFLATAIFNVLLVPPYGLVLLLNALALACSAANPLLYTLFSKNFRARTRSMFLFRHRSFHPSAQLGQIIIMGIGNHQQQQQVQQLQPNAMLL